MPLSVSLRAAPLLVRRGIGVMESPPLFLLGRGMALVSAGGSVPLRLGVPSKSRSKSCIPDTLWLCPWP